LREGKRGLTINQPGNSYHQQSKNKL
jgi:hypothetical protein